MTKPCNTCGNEIESSARVCQFCGSLQEESQLVSRKRTEKRVKKIVVKEGQPTVEEAVNRLKEEMISARQTKICVLKVVHGYGSSGKGGAIKKAVVSHIRQWKADGLIRNYMTGEQYFERGARHNYLLRRYPELKETWISDRGNPGITFIEL